jgi:hypothetical protein
MDNPEKLTILGTQETESDNMYMGDIYKVAPEVMKIKHLHQYIIVGSLWLIFLIF